MASRTDNSVRSAPIYIAMCAPILGLLALAAFTISQAVVEHARVDYLANRIALSTEASDLAHQLQKERGMSAGHIASNGAAFAAELREQRAATDAVMAEVAEAVLAVRGYGDQSRQSRRLDERAARFEAGFDRLASIRTDVDALSIAVPDVAQFYTGVIRDLLSFPDDPLMAGHIEQLARSNEIYKDFLMAKEFAGVERAVGSVGFASGGFDQATLVRFEALRERQDYLFARVRELGTPDEIALLDGALASPAKQRLDQLRMIAEESNISGDVQGVTSQEWFDAATAYLGELRRIERSKAASILSVAQERSSAAWWWVVKVGGATLVFLLAFALFGFRYVSKMIDGLAGVRSAIVRIEAAEEDIEIPAQDRKDAIGDIARSLCAISRQGADAARVRAAIEGSASPFLILDREGYAVFENEAFAAMMEKLAGKVDDLVFVGGDERRNALRLFEEIAKAEEAGRVIQKSRGEKAIEFWHGALIFEARLNRVHNRSGDEIGMSIQLEDVTDVRAIENDMISVLESVERGEFSMRVDSIDNKGFTSMAATGLNRQMDGISSFMEALEHSLQAMAAGDLTQRMETPFEGDFEEARLTVNQNLEALVEMVHAITNASHEVQNTASPIAQGARRLAQRAEEQAAALEEVNATMEQMSGAIGSAADDAKSAKDLATTASRRAKAGNDVLIETREAMSRIEQSAAKVVDIISVIDSIAFQTNLLALNAAVEAARAGDAGKGFAVVANEVRTLAQRSSEAASEIRSLISESTENVEEGVTLMERTKASLDEIKESVSGLESVIASIASSSEDQSLSAQEISTTTSHLDGLTQQNAAAAEESARGAETLLMQADRLIEQIQRFQVDAAESSTRAAATG